MLPQLQRMAPLDMLARSEKRETPFGEYLGAALAEGFDYTTTRVMLDELHASREEQRAYGITDNRPQEDDPGDFFSFPEYDPASQFRMSEEDWRKSEHYREGIEFDPRMTPVRARILAEDFDKRRYRDQLVERAPDGYAMLGFGARRWATSPTPSISSRSDSRPGAPRRPKPSARPPWRLPPARWRPTAWCCPTLPSAARMWVGKTERSTLCSPRPRVARLVGAAKLYIVDVFAVSAGPWPMMTGSGLP